jgi:hypothetical protein
VVFNGLNGLNQLKARKEKAFALGNNALKTRKLLCISADGGKFFRLFGLKKEKKASKAISQNQKNQEKEKTKAVKIKLKIKTKQ